MNLIIVATQEWMSARGLIPLPTMKKNKDGSKIVLHREYLNFLAGRDGEVELGDAQVYVHNSKKLDELMASEEWQGSEEVAEASAGFIQAAAVRNLMVVTKAGIQSLEMTDDEALQVKDLYPAWEEFVGKSLSIGMKVLYAGKLYRVRQEIASVLENQPPSIDTAALYEEINETHAGTLEDPIPYNNNMELEQGKYYTQSGVTYYCHTGSGQAVYNDLKDLTVFVTAEDAHTD